MATLKDKAKKALPTKTEDEVPGPSPDPATNLAMADIAVRAVTYVAREKIEKALLKNRYSPDAAERIIRNRPKSQVLASMIAAKVATRSIPGAAVVGTGIALKALFDLSQRRRARRRGEKVLAKRARDED